MKAAEEPGPLQKQIGQLQMKIGKLTKMISDLLKQLTGLDLNVCRFKRIFGDFILFVAYLQALTAMIPGKADGIQQIQKLVGDLVAGLSAG